MLNVVMLSNVMVGVITVSVSILRVVMLSEVMVGVIMVSVFKLNVVAPMLN